MLHPKNKRSTTIIGKINFSSFKEMLKARNNNNWTENILSLWSNFLMESMNIWPKNGLQGEIEKKVEALEGEKKFLNQENKCSRKNVFCIF